MRISKTHGTKGYNIRSKEKRAHLEDTRHKFFTEKEIVEVFITSEINTKQTVDIYQNGNRMSVPWLGLVTVTS
jgi:hypothetical protein